MRFIRFQAATLTVGVIFALLLATPLVQQAGYAQATSAAGAIQGTTTDPGGAILPGASITITNVATDAKRVLVSDSAGFYSVSSLAPGKYQVSATASGFATTTTTLTVQIGTTTNGDLRLKLGAASEQVIVSSDAVQVNTVQSTVSGVLTEQQIDNLPISGRNFLDLSQLEPGVQLQSGETFDPTKAGYSSISFNGVNGRAARILLDGQDISDETVGTTTLNVSQGSIEEFQISRSSLDISNELTSSGAVTVSTHSGTNQYHGQGFGLFRDERSGAAAGPDGTTYPFQRNQFGGRVGGPVLKDKLFLFGSVERVKQDAFNAVAVAAPFSGFNGGYIAPFRDNYYVSRADYNAPKGIHLFARIAYEDNLDDATYGYGFSRYGNKDNTPAIAGGGDFLIGKFTNSLRWSYLKFHNQIANEAGGLPAEAAGLPPLPTDIEMFFFTQNLITGPNLLAPQQTYQSDKQVRYDGGTTIRTHQIQYGVSLNRILGGGFASFFGFGPEVDGAFSAGSVATGSITDPNPLDYAAADVFLGNGEGYNTEHAQFGLPAGGQADWRMGIYAGDTWKINGKLTVNAGVRYSRDTGRSDSDLPPIPCSDAVAQWGASSPCTTGNLLDSIVPGLKLGTQVRQPNMDFGPKAGFAYDWNGNGKTVIRGGAGLYFENNIFNNVLFDRPARLTSGLFWNGLFEPSGTPNFKLPTGATITSVNGVPIASLWNEPISQSAPYFAAWQAEYQAATKTAGAATNTNYAANSLTEGPVPNGYSLYVPNFRTARSIQINIGVQRQVWKDAVFSADYIRNVGEHFQMSIDENHVGDASHFNKNAAALAVSDTLTECGVANVDAALASCPGLYQPDPTLPGYHPSKTVLLSDFAGAHFDSVGNAIDGGLDSGNASLGGHPAASQGLTPDTGAAFAGINPLFGQMAFNLPMGRSVYNGLQTNLRQGARIPFPGLKGSNFEISYTLSRFTSAGGHDQNFTPGAIDNNRPLAFAGPDSQDRTTQISYGGTFGWIGGVETSLIGHYYSALPTTLTLDPNGNPPGEIYSSDLTGDGTIGDLLPGYKAGAFMRSVKPNQLAKVVANYNATSAGLLTPAGQAVVGSGLITSAQMTALGAVTPTIAAPPDNNAGNGSLRTFDMTLARKTKLRWLGEAASVEPTISFFNLFNFANFNGYSYTSVNKTGGGSLANFQQTGTVNGTDTSYSDNDPFNRSALRAGNGSGVFGQGTARVIEYGLKINF